MDGKYGVALDYEGTNRVFEDLAENEPETVVLAGLVEVSGGATVGTRVR